MNKIKPETTPNSMRMLSRFILPSVCSVLLFASGDAFSQPLRLESTIASVGPAASIGLDRSKTLCVGNGALRTKSGRPLTRPARIARVVEPRCKPDRPLKLRINSGVASEIMIQPDGGIFWTRGHNARMLDLRKVSYKAKTKLLISKPKIITPIKTVPNGNLQVSIPNLNIQTGFPAPRNRALVVILENGGIMSNIPNNIKQSLQGGNYSLARCNSLDIRLEAGESIVQMIGRVGEAAISVASCLNPFNWSIEQRNLYTDLNNLTDQLIEDAVKGANSVSGIRNKYQQYVVLEDGQATPARVMQELRRLAPNYTIDVHVLTHGSNNSFVGGNNERFTRTSFFDNLKPDADQGRLHIRAVYQMNCVGGTLKDEWQSIGAKTVNGTRGTLNNYMPHQYFYFLKRWTRQNESMRSA